MKRVATNNNNHGGAREGAGRKPSGPDTVPVNWRISESAKTWMKAKAVEDGVNIGAILDRLIQHYEAVNSAVKVANNALTYHRCVLE